MLAHRRYALDVLPEHSHPRRGEAFAISLVRLPVRAVDITSSDQPPPARALLRRPGYVAYWAARFLATFAVQIVSVSVGWQVYDITP